MWEIVKQDINNKKASPEQIKYAEILLEAMYGDINLPIYTMSKAEISKVIDETKSLCKKFKVNYNKDRKRY